MIACLAYFMTLIKNTKTAKTEKGESSQEIHSSYFKYSPGTNHAHKPRVIWPLT